MVLLPKAEGPVDLDTVMSILAPSSSLSKDCRSVLDGETRRQRVMWNMSQNRVDMKNEKLRRCHLELVIACVMRAQAASASQMRDELSTHSFNFI